METYISPYSQDFNYNKMMSSLRNLNLSPCNQERFSRNNVHAGIYASHYSCYSPKPEFFDQANNVRGPELLDRAPQRNLQSNGGNFSFTLFVDRLCACEFPRFFSGFYENCLFSPWSMERLFVLHVCSCFVF